MHQPRYDAIIIGAGQSGLAAARELARRELRFVVLEAGRRVGDNWRARYDSLLLYSPARYDALPGLSFPMPGHAFPTGRQMGDYLEAYAAHHELPVRTGVAVDGLARREDGGFDVTAGTDRYVADQVVVATGPFQHPRVPDFAAELDPGIRQIHSAEYRDPSQLQEGPVLVVGLSHSGADLAMEAATSGHRTILSGEAHGQLPFSVDSRRARVAWPLMRFVAMNLLTLRTPIGRKMAPKVRKGGGPLLRHRRADLDRAGVERHDARTVGVEDGKPRLADGTVLDVANVIWCTGFRADYGWIRLPVVGEDGWPVQDRGAAEAADGLYFLGLPFLFGFTSMLVLGAARDAAHVAELIARRAAVRRSPETVAGEHAT
jgi:putative flavoprotein involved in K+ transport